MRKPVRPRLPEVGEGRRGEEGYLGYLLRQAAAAHRIRVDRALADLGVTAPQFTILTMLKAYPGVSGADLARLAALTPQTVSVILANLERDGWIARGADAVHGRVHRIALTEAGLGRLQACRGRVHAVEAALAEGVTEGEQRLLRRWLVRVARDGAAPSGTRVREPSAGRAPSEPAARWADADALNPEDDTP